MRILWLANVPSPYRVNFFNELGKKCQLTVLFERKTSDIRDKSWKNYRFSDFDGIFLKGVKMGEDAAFCPGVLKYLKKNTYDHIIVSDFTNLTGMLAIEYMRIRHMSYWLESDGGFAKNGKGAKEKLKVHIIQGSDLYFSTGKSHDAYYLQYGAKKDKLYRYPFTSIYDSDILPAPVSSNEKKEIRERLGITEDKVILAVGQFIHRKGFDLLLKACKKLDNHVGVYFVGGEATQEYVHYVAENKMTNIHFVGFKLKRDLAEFYKAADLFVLPTREDIWGLVVNEAMAYGLPVITTDRCAAGMELVEDDVNGYLIESENVDQLQHRIISLVMDDELLSKMSEQSLKIIKNFSIEAMVQSHLNAFELHKDNDNS